MDYDQLLSTAKSFMERLELTVSDLPMVMMDDDTQKTVHRLDDEIIMAHYQEDSLRVLRTVRFLKDFVKYRASVHKNTTNTSFVRTATLLKEMGIKNYYFMLQINNPLLLNVDPYDPKLTDEVRAMIVYECQTNFWYFLREVVRVGGGNVFKANRANISFIWCYLNHLNTILIMPRQKGKTVSAQVIIFWLQYITGQNYESHLITLKDDNRSQFVEAIKSIRNNIPKWMTEVTYRDKDSGNSLTYSGYGEKKKNILRISVPQQGEEAARNVGRGGTVKTRMIDEPAYIKLMETILNGAGPATLTARKLAREKGEPYGTGFITTPASVRSESGAFMRKMLMNSSPWRELYLDCFSESHLYTLLIANSPEKTTSPMVGMVYNYLQLGENPDWVMRTIDELKLSLSEAKIDLLLMWDDTSKGKLFDDITRDALNNSKRPVLWSQKVEGTQLFFDWFITREQHAAILSGESGSFYLIGCDTSAAISRDACTLIIRDIRTGNVIGAGRYQRAYLTDVGSLIEMLLTEITNSLLIIERNFAQHMIDQLLISLPAIGLDPFKRIFNRIYQDPIKYANELATIKERSFGNRNEDFYLRYKEYFGFLTDARTREEMYGFIKEAVGTTGGGAAYSYLLDELMELKEKNGRIDHDAKSHDDLVIAWMLTYWFIKLGQSKTHYGIPPGVVLSDVKLMSLGQTEESSMSNDQRIQRMKIYRTKIETLTEALLKTKDSVVAKRLEMMIDKLSQFIPAEIRKTMTIDEIKHQAQEMRNKRKFERVIKRNHFLR